jgi:aminomethyltransferase
MSGTLAQTPLHDWHAAHHGRLVDFAGWSMPVQYSSIVAEHQATRTAAGIFDISHMGRLRFDGPGAGTLLDSLLTRRVADQKPGQIRYSLVTDDAGGILDDVLLYHLVDAAGTSYRLLVVNASNREKILAWIERHLAGHHDASMTDLTHDWAMLAVQGPRALDLVQPLAEVELRKLKYYTGTEGRIAGHAAIVSRTGYTGEDGCELIVEADAATGIWQQLIDAGATPAGLGCRDTLRLEAGMPLYGHELWENIDPFQAGLAFAVNLEGRQFVGRDALVERQKLAEAPRRVGLSLTGKRVPREDYAIMHQARQVGEVTSGTFSPTLDRPIAMGYVEPAFAQPGQRLEIDIRGRGEAATVVELPFYRRPTT